MSDHATNLKAALKVEKALDKIDAKESASVAKAHTAAKAARLKATAGIDDDVAALMSDRTP